MSEQGIVDCILSNMCQTFIRILFYRFIEHWQKMLGHCLFVKKVLVTGPIPCLGCWLRN